MWLVKKKDEQEAQAPSPSPPPAPVQQPQQAIVPAPTPQATQDQMNQMIQLQMLQTMQKMNKESQSAPKPAGTGGLALHPLISQVKQAISDINTVSTELAPFVKPNPAEQFIGIVFNSEFGKAFGNIAGQFATIKVNEWMQKQEIKAQQQAQVQAQAQAQAQQNAQQQPQQPVNAQTPPQTAQNPSQNYELKLNENEKKLIENLFGSFEKTNKALEILTHRYDEIDKKLNDLTIAKQPAPSPEVKDAEFKAVKPEIPKAPEEETEEMPKDEPEKKIITLQPKETLSISGNKVSRQEFDEMLEKEPKIPEEIINELKTVKASELSDEDLADLGMDKEPEPEPKPEPIVVSERQAEKIAERVVKEMNEEPKPKLKEERELYISKKDREKMAKKKGKGRK